MTGIEDRKTKQIKVSFDAHAYDFDFLQLHQKTGR